MISFIKEFWDFLKERKKYWLFPIVVVLGLFGILIVLSQSRYWGIRNAADVWIRTFLMAFDLQAQHITFVLIGISLALIPIAKSKAGGIKLKANYFALMLAESIALSLVLGIVLQSILRLGGLSSGGTGDGLMQNLALSVGAGLFEEIIFRVILLNLLFP